MSIGYQDCSCTLTGSSWVLDGDPFFVNRVTEVFKLAKVVGNRAVIPATPDQSRDLMWFRTRYGFKVHPEPVLIQMAAQQLVLESEAADILSSDYEPDSVEFANGESPRPHQYVAGDLWKTVRRLLIADGLGVGKTVSALTAIADPKLRPSVIVMPVHLLKQWQSQIKRFVPDFFVHVIQTVAPYPLNVVAECMACGAKVDAKLQEGRKRFKCTSCGSLLIGSDRRIPDVILAPYTRIDKWDEMLAASCRSIVFEEAHALRRHDTNKWRSAHAIAQKVPYSAGLTATPIFNLGGEIYNIMECIAPGFLGDRDPFYSTHCEYKQSGKEPALKNPLALGEYLRKSNRMIRRTAAEVGISVDEINRIYHEIDASEDIFDRETSRAGELARILLSDAKLQRGDAMRASGEMEQIVRQATGLAKAPFVAAFVEMLVEQGLPVVLFAWHQAVHDVLMENLSKRCVPVKYTGTESLLTKQASFERFVKGDANVFICSLRAGEGIDGLQFRAKTIVTAELDWAPAIHQQNEGRLARPGQTEPTTAFYMVSEYGLDPVMSQVLGIKKNQSDGLLGSMATGPKKTVDSTMVMKEYAKRYLHR